MTTPPMPLCLVCRRFNADNERALTCQAFPQGIPETILLSNVDHRKPVEGDNDLLFDPVDAQALAHAEMLFPKG